MIKICMIILFLSTGGALAAEGCAGLDLLKSFAGAHEIYNCHVEIFVSEPPKGCLDCGRYGSIYVKDRRSGGELLIPVKDSFCLHGPRVSGSKSFVGRRRKGFDWSLAETIEVWFDSQSRLLRMSARFQGKTGDILRDETALCSGALPVRRRGDFER